MAGMFDDLIPGGGQVAAPPASAGMFDDLVPEASPAKGARGAAEYTPEQGWLEWLEDRARAVAQGTTYRFGDELAAGAGAAGNFVARKLGMDIPERSYGQIKDEISGEQQRFEESNPATAIGLEIGGAVLTPGMFAGRAAQAGNAVANATRTGAVGRGLTAGAITGAPAGALYGAGASEADTAGGVAMDTLQGGLTGAAAGGAISGVAIPAITGTARAAGRAIAPFTSALRSALNPEAEALRRVGGTIAEDTRQGVPRAIQPLSEREFDAALRRGQPVLPLELGGSNTRALARASANANPTARDVLEAATDPRFAGQSERTADFLRTLNVSPNWGKVGGNAAETREALKTVAQQIRTPLYQNAYKAGAGGIDDKVLEQLQTAPALAGKGGEGSERAMGGAMGEARTRIANRHAVEGTGGNVEDRIVGPNGYTLEFWDAAKQSLDDRIEKALGQGANGEARELIAVRDKLLSVLDKKVPAYADARGTASTFFGASNAFDAGEKFASAGSRLKNDEARIALSKLSEEERAIFGEAFISRKIAQADEHGDRRNIVNQIANSPAERERMEMVLGGKGMRRLKAQLRVEGAMERGREAVKGNSTTTRQLVELGLVGGGTGAGAGYSYLSGDPSGYAAAAFLAGRKGAKMAAERNVAKHAAELLTSTDPAKRAAILKALQKTNKPSALAAALRRASAPATRAAISVQNQR
jgi:hypothetical protein